MNYSFTNKIFKQRGNPYVDVPQMLSDSLIEALGRDGYLPVCVTVNGLEYTATLTPRGGGAFRLFITDEMRKRKGFKVGMTIRVSVALASSTSANEWPTDLAEAFSAQPAAQTAFEQQTPQRRQELLRWLQEAKDTAGRAKHLEHILAYLTTGQI